MSANSLKGPRIGRRKLPLLVSLMAFAVGYAYLFLDSHLERFLEARLTRLNLAQVDIGHLKTKWLSGEVHLDHLSVTNYRKPLYNLVEIGTVRFKVSLHHLLRKQLHVSNLQVDQVRYDTHRPSSGKLFSAHGDSQTVVARDIIPTFYRSLRKSMDVNPIEQLIRIPTRPPISESIEALKTDLALNTKRQAVEEAIHETKNRWNEAEMSLPSLVELAHLKQERQQSPKADQVKRQQRYLAQTQKTYQQMKQDLTRLSAKVEALKGTLPEDRRLVEKALALPTLPQDLSRFLFADKLLNAFERFTALTTIVRRLRPPGAHADAETYVTKDAPQSSTFHFLSPGHSRLFIGPMGLTHRSPELDYSLITSPIRTAAGADDVFSVNASFSAPTKEIQGLHLRYLSTRSHGLPKETLELQIKQFPISQWLAMDRAGMKFTIHNARASLNLSVQFEKNELSSEFEIAFGDAVYGFETRYARLREAIQGVNRSTPDFTIGGRLHGAFSALDLKLKSQLGRALSSRLGREYAPDLRSVKEEIQSELSKRLQGEQRWLEQQITQLKEVRLATVSRRLAALNGLETEFSPQTP